MAAAPASGAPLSSYRVVKAPDRGKVLVGRFDQIVTVTPQRRAAGTLELPRVLKVRPDLDKCPGGLAMTMNKKSPEITIGHTAEMRKPAMERPLGAEVYDGERQEMPAKHLVMWKRKDAEGNDYFEASVVDSWFAFSKSTTLTLAARQQDPDEAEKEFEQMQKTGLVKRSRMAGMYSRLAARKGLTLASVSEGAPDEAEEEAEEGAEGKVQVGGLCVEEKFTRVQVDDDDRFEESYRSGFESAADKKAGKGRRRTGYSGIHGSDRRVEHADREVVADDDAALLGDFGTEQERDEAIFTEFDDDDDAAVETAMLMDQDGAREAGYEEGAEAVVAAGEEDDEDAEGRGDEEEDEEEDTGPGTTRLVIMGAGRMSVAQRKRRQQQRADAARAAAAASSASSAAAAAGARKRGRGEEDAEAAGPGADGAGSSDRPKRARTDVATTIQRLSRRLFVSRGGTVTSKTLDKFVSKLAGKYGQAGRSMAVELVGRLALLRGDGAGGSVWELRPEEWARAAEA